MSLKGSRAQKYVLQNIATLDVVVPKDGDPDNDLIHRALFHDPIGVTLANDCLRDAGSDWRWVPLHDEVKHSQHEQDSDCTVDQDTLCCTICGVDHSEACLDCGGRGYHKETCPAMLANRPTLNSRFA